VSAWTRDDSWARSKLHGEKWPRFSAEVPPELAKALDEAQRRSLGNDYSPTNATRANMVRAGLRLYLNRVDPEPEPAIESTAVEVVEVKRLAARRRRTGRAF
jgi:hypothetical protein